MLSGWARQEDALLPWPGNLPGPQAASLVCGAHKTWRLKQRWRQKMGSVHRKVCKAGSEFPRVPGCARGSALGPALPRPLMALADLRALKRVGSNRNA